MAFLLLKPNDFIVLSRLFGQCIRLATSIIDPWCGNDFPKNRSSYKDQVKSFYCLYHMKMPYIRESVFFLPKPI
ncbi:MAG: hypothetical protein ACTSXG_01905 [Alphaproteobacteria bacterium]